LPNLRIIILDGASNGAVLESQFNPKQIDIQKIIPWQHQSAKTAGPSDLTYTHTEVRPMLFELLFDGSTTATSIQPQIDLLQTMSDVDAVLKRPPKVRVLWGVEGTAGLMPKFDAVIETLDVKYTMFDPEGRPMRATVDLKLKEARNISVSKSA